MITIRRTGKIRRLMVPLPSSRPAGTRAPTSGRRAGLRLRRVPQQGPLPENKVQIAAVHKQPAPLAEDEYRVPLVDRIGEQDDAARDAAIPEGDRNDASPFHLAAEPLKNEAGGKH